MRGGFQAVGDHVKNQRWEIGFALLWPLIGIAVALFLPLIQILLHWIWGG